MTYQIKNINVDVLLAINSIFALKLASSHSRLKRWRELNGESWYLGDSGDFSTVRSSKLFNGDKTPFNEMIDHRQRNLTGLRGWLSAWPELAQSLFLGRRARRLCVAASFFGIQ